MQQVGGFHKQALCVVPKLLPDVLFVLLLLLDKLKSFQRKTLG